MSRFVLKKIRDHSPQASAARYQRKVEKAKKKSEGGKPLTKSDRVLLEGRRFVTFCVNAEEWSSFLESLPAGVSANEWFNDWFPRCAYAMLTPTEPKE